MGGYQRRLWGNKTVDVGKGSYLRGREGGDRGRIVRGGEGGGREGGSGRREGRGRGMWRGRRRERGRGRGRGTCVFWKHDVSVRGFTLDHLEKAREVLGENSEEVPISRELYLCGLRPFAVEEGQNSVGNSQGADTQTGSVDSIEIVLDIVGVVTHREEESANVLGPDVVPSPFVVLLGREVDEDFLCDI